MKDIKPQISEVLRILSRINQKQTNKTPQIGTSQQNLLQTKDRGNLLKIVAVEVGGGEQREKGGQITFKKATIKLS